MAFFWGVGVHVISPLTWQSMESFLPKSLSFWSKAFIFALDSRLKRVLRLSRWQGVVGLGGREAAKEGDSEQMEVAIEQSSKSSPASSTSKTWPDTLRGIWPSDANKENRSGSLTQFYSGDFSKSRIGVKKCVFNKRTMSRFASAVVDGVLGPPRIARHTWRCPCISVVPEATHEASRGPKKGAVSAQKALRGSKTETRELLGGTEENSVSPRRGVIDLPSR